MQQEELGTELVNLEEQKNSPKPKQNMQLKAKVNYKKTTKIIGGIFSILLIVGLFSYINGTLY